MITPWQYAKDSEHSQQVALFMWAGMAERYGFLIANNEALWPTLAAMGGKAAPSHLSNPVPELRWLHAIPNGGLRSKVTAGRLVAEGVKKGVYDVFWPVTCKMFAGLYIEMKKPGVVTDRRDPRTPEQKAFAGHLDVMGYAHIYCDNWETAANRIRQHWERR